MLAFVLGCDASTAPDQESGPDRLRALADSLTLHWIGETARLLASVQAQNGSEISDRVVTWHGTEGAVASVDSSGNVTALRPGTASAIGESGDLVVTVPVRVIQIPAQVQMMFAGGASPTPESETLLSSFGDTFRLATVVKDHGGTVIPSAEIRWTSSNPLIATVDSSGLVTARANGTASIVATSGVASNTAAVRVRQEAATLVLDTSTVELTWLGQSRTLVVSARDHRGNVATGMPVTWRSSEPVVATVDNAGAVVAKSVGRTTITASSGAVQASATVSVAQIPVGVKLDPPGLLLDYIGASATLQANAVDKGGAPIPGAGMQWSSSAPGTASVDQKGAVFAVALGKAIITASSGAFSGKVDVEVRQVPARIRLLPGELRLFTSPAKDGTLGAAIVDRGGNVVASSDPIAWRSRNEAVATVANGVVSPVATGETWVIASASGFADSAIVRVNGQRFVLDRHAATIDWTASVTISATYIDDNSVASVIAPSLTSRNEQIAPTTGATIVGGTGGSTWVVASYRGETDSLRVTVEHGPNRLELHPASSRQWTGTDVEFSALALNGAGKSQDVTGSTSWETRDSAVAHNAPTLRWIHTEHAGFTWVIARNERYGLVDSTRIEVVAGQRFFLTPDTLRLDWGTESRVRAIWLQDDFTQLGFDWNLASRDESIARASGSRIFGANVGSTWVYGEYRNQTDSTLVIVEHGPTRMEAGPRDRVIPIHGLLGLYASAFNASGASVEVPVEWIVRDLTVLERSGVSDVRGLKPGTTWVIARNLTYHLADSVQVTVSPIWHDDLVISSQSDVDRIHAWGITEVHGDLDISHTDLTNVDGLASIRLVWDNITVDGNPSLSSLAGLRVETMGRELVIQNNPALTNLNSLSGLTGQLGILTIVNNTGLVDVSGLSHLGASLGSDPIVGGLTIAGNTSLAVANINALISAIEARYPGSAIGASRIEGNGP